MCATQGLKFLSILGVSQAARFCPFNGFRGCVRFPKTLVSRHFLFSFISAKIFILFLSSFLLQFNAFLVKTSPLLARKFLVQTFLFSFIHTRKNLENKSDWQGFFFTKREEKVEKCRKIKDFGKDRTNLAKS